MSRCGFKGVSKNNYGKWQARISVKGKSVALGSYDTPEEASKVYEAAVIHYRVQGYKYEAGSFLRAIKEDASTPESAQPGHAETLAVMPQSELQAVPADGRERATATTAQGCAGCGRSLRDNNHCAAFPACPRCPRCGSSLYTEVGGGYLCRQCGAQPRILVPPGLSRAQLEDEHWMAEHVSHTGKLVGV